MEYRQTTGRKMKRNHSNALPRYIISLDTETLPYDIPDDSVRKAHRFRLAVAIVVRLRGTEPSGRKTYYFRNVQAIWKLIHEHSAANYTTWIVCHNALFDMVIAGMSAEFQESRLVVDWPRSKRDKGDDATKDTQKSGVVCIESPPTIIACKSTVSQGRIVIVDTLNWFQCKLADLGESCGLQKLPMPAFEASDNEWFEYCERDTEITLQAFVELVKWVKDNDMGMFRYTGPAQSMAAFRHRFMSEEILVHDNLPVKVLERSAYFGGRFECFYLGEINEIVHQVDVNSLFPSVMRRNQYPVALDRFSMETNWSTQLPAIDYARSIAEVQITTYQPDYPLRDRRGTLYPCGKFTTALAGPELAAAFKTGRITAVRSWSEYRTADIFTSFVDTLWKMRRDYQQAGNKLYDRFTKQLMNSLYGKFAQRAPEWVVVPERMYALPWSNWVEYDPGTGEKTEFRSFGWQCEKRQERDLRHEPTMDITDWEAHAAHFGAGELPTTFVAVSAFVTAYARMRMNYLRELTGNEQVLYQGVDSLIVRSDGLSRLRRNGEVCDSSIGKLRTQITTDNGIILGCSDYRLGDKTVIAGKPRAATLTDGMVQMQRRFMAKDKLFSGRAIAEITEEQFEWKRNSTYWKGDVHENGQVWPLVLGGMDK